MAMLAEPRQRKRYNLVPRGKALYEDESRFGTKMLEKMGWKKGEGLGANSEGSKDFIRIRYKNDAYGLGFEQRDDQWTEHEQSFNGLLSTLNNNEGGASKNQEGNDTEPLRAGFGFQKSTLKEETAVNTGKMKEKISGISLEERSKQSKARVHYKKFTKGKDLAQYSEKDLANIFGKKAVDEEQEANAFYKNLNEVFGVITEDTGLASTNGLEAESEETSKKKDKKKRKKVKEGEEGEAVSQTDISEDKTDTQTKTYTSSLSVQDYFKMKMEAIQNRKTNITSTTESKNVERSPNDESKEDIRKLKKKRKKELENDCSYQPTEKKSKKIKKQFDQDMMIDREVTQETEVAKKDKKSKKREESHRISQETKSKTGEALGNFLEEPKEIKLKAIEDIHNQNVTLGKDDQILEDFGEKRSKKIKKSGSGKQDTTQIEERARTISNKVVPETEESKIKSKEPQLDTIHQESLKENGQNWENSKNVISKPIDSKVTESKSEKKKLKTKKENGNTSINSSTTKVPLDEKSGLANTPETSAIVDLTEEPTSRMKKKSKKDISETTDINFSENMELQKKVDAILETENKTDECLTAQVNKKSKKTKMNGVLEFLTGNRKKADENVKNKQKESGDAETQGQVSTADVKEPFAVVDLTMEPTKKKKKKNKDKNEINDVVHIVDDSDGDDIDNENGKPSNEIKSLKPPVASEKNDMTEDKPNPINILSNLLGKKTEENLAKNEVTFQDIDIEELKQKYEAFNILTISTFCAEKFRNIDANEFKGSTLPQIEGYGLSQDIQLDIKVCPMDEVRISNLWRNAFSKYDQTLKPQMDYRSYVQGAIKALRTKQRPKNLNIKSWQRKNAFQVL